MDLTKSFLALVLLVQAGMVAHARPPQGQDDSPARPVFHCTNFEHLDDGTWKGKAHAAATFKGSRFNFAGTILRSGEVLIDGVDMKSRLDAQCLANPK